MTERYVLKCWLESAIMSGVCSKELFGVVGAGSLEEAGLAVGEGQRGDIRL